MEHPLMSTVIGCVQSPSTGGPGGRDRPRVEQPGKPDGKLVEADDPGGGRLVLVYLQSSTPGGRRQGRIFVVERSESLSTALCRSRLSGRRASLPPVRKYPAHAVAVPRGKEVIPCLCAFPSHSRCSSRCCSCPRLPPVGPIRLRVEVGSSTSRNPAIRIVCVDGVGR